MQVHIKAQNSKLPLFIVSSTLLIIYKVIIDLVYVYIISPIYEYSGHVVDFSLNKYLLSWLYLLLIVFLIPKDKSKVSYMVLQLHAIVMIIPMLSIYGLANLSSDFILMIMGCFIIEIIIVRSNKFVLNIPTIVNSKNLLISIISVCTIVTYVSLIYANGIHLEAIDFFNVYALRENINIPFGFLDYLATWQYRIINPYIIISSYTMNKKGMFKLFIGLQILLYFIIPYKEILLSVFLIIGLSLFLERFNFLKSAIYGVLVTTIGAIIIYLAKISIMPLAVVPTRLLFEPALIKFQHFEVFSMHLDKMYFSEGLIGKILGINYPYSQPSGFVVNSYFGAGTSNSNTGYLAYAYDNLGFIGMIFMSLLFILIMLFIDSLSVKLNKNFVFALIIYQMFMLNDGDLLTLLLTGGLFLSILILLLDQKSFDSELIEKRLNQINSSE